MLQFFPTFLLFFPSSTTKSSRLWHFYRAECIGAKFSPTTLFRTDGIGGKRQQKFFAMHRWSLELDKRRREYERALGERIEQSGRRELGRQQARKLKFMTQIKVCSETGNSHGSKAPACQSPISSLCCASVGTFACVGARENFWRRAFCELSGKCPRKKGLSRGLCWCCWDIETVSDFITPALLRCLCDTKFRCSQREERVARREGKNRFGIVVWWCKLMQDRIAPLTDFHNCAVRESS